MRLVKEKASEQEILVDKPFKQTHNHQLTKNYYPFDVKVGVRQVSEVKILANRQADHVVIELIRVKGHVKAKICCNGESLLIYDRNVGGKPVYLALPADRDYKILNCDVRLASIGECCNNWLLVEEAVCFETPFLNYLHQHMESTNGYFKDGKWYKFNEANFGKFLSLFDNTNQHYLCRFYEKFLPD